MISCNGIEPGWIILPILRAGYAYYPVAVSASATRRSISPFAVWELSTAGVQAMVRDSLCCTVLARDAGYDRVEIMGSKDYLINQFLVARTNQRNDEYDSDRFANQMRLDVEIVLNTREACGPNFITIFNLGLLDLVEGGNTWEEVKALAQALEDAGVSILNTDIGWRDARIRE